MAAATATLVALAAACGAAEPATDTADADGDSASVPGVTETRRQALDLYLTRQEYITAYYGRDGRTSTPEPVRAAVDRTEARFRDLMRLLGETPPPGARRLSEAVRALLTAYDDLLERADAAGRLPAPAEPWVEGTPDGGLVDWIADVRRGLVSLERG